MSSTGSDAPDVSVALELFRFFEEMTRLKEAKDFLSVDRYDTVRWFAELPDHPAVHSEFGEEDLDLSSRVLRVDRVDKVDPPQPPAQLVPWLTGYRRGDADSTPQLLRVREVPGTQGEEDDEGEPDDAEPEVYRIEDFPEIEQRNAEWIPRWQMWAEEERRNRPVRDLYAQLAKIERQVSVTPEEWDLVVGVGLLTCRSQAADDTDLAGEAAVDDVKRHVFVFPATVELDETAGAYEVSLDEALEPFRLELDMVARDLWPTRDQQETIKARIANEVGHPLERGGMLGVLNQLVTVLTDPEARLDQRVEPPSTDEITATLTVQPSPALIFRRRPRAAKLEYFRTVIEQLTELEEQGGDLPNGLARFLGADAHEQAVTADTDAAEESGESSYSVDETYLPLPANDEQLRIVKSVDRKDLTVVQGPPGTGKTHTIANLLGHLLANGKRVLITAQKDQALQEVRGKLPDDLRDLCVYIPPRGRGSSQLARSASVYLEKKDDHDPDRYERERTELEETIPALLEAKATATAGLLRARQWETRVEEVEGGYDGTPGAIAGRLASESGDYGWVLSYLADPDVNVPSNNEALEFLNLVRDPEIPEHQIEALKRLPGELETRFAHPDQFHNTVNALTAATAAAEANEHLRQDPLVTHLQGHTSHTLGSIEETALKIANALRQRLAAQESWLAAAHADLLAGNNIQWEGRAGRVESALAEARQHAGQIGSSTIKTDDPTPRRFREQAEDLKAHLQRGGRFKRLFRAPEPVRDAEELLAAVRVDDHPPKSVESLEKFLAWLEVKRRIEMIRDHWPEGFPEYEEDTPEEVLDWHEFKLSQLRELIDEHRSVETFRDQLDRLMIPQPAFDQTEKVEHYATVAQAVRSFQAVDLALQPLKELSESLSVELREADSPQALTDLLTATNDKNPTEYRESYRRLQLLEEVRTRIERRNKLDAVLTGVSTKLVQDIVEDPSEAWDIRLGAFAAAAAWRSARQWVSSPPDDSGQLRSDLDTASDQLKKTRSSLITNLAWDKAMSALTHDDLASLTAYDQARQAVGAGTGKYAATRKRQAQRALSQCRGAIPAWVAALSQLFEDMPPEPGMFDVVIIDEASQAGVEASILHYLAPTVIVIGDDKQVKPTNISVNVQDLMSLVNNYLSTIAENLRTIYTRREASFFDQAKLRSLPITLREHFRCVPEIIQFSNEQFYKPAGTSLIPLRQTGTDRLQPLPLTYVENGYRNEMANPPEADAVVEAVCQCVNDPAYTREGPDGPEPMSMGVISLLGDTQAKLIEGLLLERLGEAEYRARDLRCGTAEDFQGAERDVIFLSMVAAPTGVKQDGVTPLRYAAAADAAAGRRFNVACSRAKDQMWLFHSLEIGNLDNSNDLRLKLLQFYLNQATNPETAESTLVSEDVKEAPFDSLFEQRVHNEIVKKGYQVVPQWEIHGKRIDLAVVGAHGRLAVECDGEFWHTPDTLAADNERQLALERTGLKFFRIRESAFYLDRGEALAPLWPLLQGQGIYSRAEQAQLAAPQSSEDETTPGRTPDPPEGPEADLEILESNELPTSVENPETAFDDDQDNEDSDEQEVQVEEQSEPDRPPTTTHHPPGGATLGMGAAETNPETAESTLVSEDVREAPFDSLLEQRVYNEIVKKGYQVVPQWEIHGRRIDLAVVGAHGRLAVECDGDYYFQSQQSRQAEHERQLALERIGLRSFRILESAFYLDREEALAPLWPMLYEQGIYSRAEQAQLAVPQGTESRSISETQDRLDEILDLVDSGEPADRLELIREREHLRSRQDELRAAKHQTQPVQRTNRSRPSRLARRRNYRIRYEAEQTCKQCYLLRRPAHFGDPTDPQCPEGRSDCPLLEEVFDESVNPTLVPEGTSGGPDRSTSDSPELGRQPYTEWTAPSSPYPEIEETSEGTAQAIPGLVDIVSVEGPITGKRLYALYVRATGGRRVTRPKRSVLNRATARVVRDGLLVGDDPLNEAGQATKTFRLPNQPEVVVRDLGPRDIHDVPPAEVAKLMVNLDRAGSTDGLFRAVLHWYGLTRLTEQTEERLQQIFDRLVQPPG